MPLTKEKIKFGKWNIPLNRILNAQFLEVDTLFGSKQILKIQTKTYNYRFEMELNPEWKKQKALPLTFERKEIENPIQTSYNHPDSIYKPFFRIKEMS